MKRSPLLHLVLGALVIFYAYIAGTLIRSEQSRPNKEEPGFHTSQFSGPPRTYDLIVKFKESTPQSVIKELASHLHATVLNNYTDLPGLSFESIETTDSLDEVIASYKTVPNVEYVEQNFT